MAQQPGARAASSPVCGQWAPGEDYLAAGDVAVQIIVRLAAFAPAQAKILDGAMQRVRRQCPIDTLALKLLRAHFGAQVNRQASTPTMLVEWASAHARASQAQHYRPAIVARRSKELALEAIEAHRAFAPCFARPLGGKAANGTRQLAHQRLIRARLERDNRVVLDTHRGAKLLGQEVPQVYRQGGGGLGTPPRRPGRRRPP